MTISESNTLVRRAARTEQVSQIGSSSFLLVLGGAVLVAGLLGLVGCAGSLNGTGSSSNGGDGAPSGHTQGVLTPSSPSVSFGNVTIGTSTAQLVSLKNTGDSNVKISAVSITGSGFSVSGGSNMTLTPDQSVTISVNFTASGAGLVQGAVSVSSNASDKVLQISVTATGVQAAQHSVTLTWQPSTSVVHGFFVYRGPTASNLSKLTHEAETSTSYTDRSVVNGETYVYEVTAVDPKNMESTPSTAVTVTIPAN